MKQSKSLVKSLCYQPGSQKQNFLFPRTFPAIEYFCPLVFRRDDLLHVDTDGTES